ncbi:MAG: dihydroxyacetone kinase subunit L [Planctomycetaceae bacterium]|jgi:dihydroxyacetone kinase-like protein|nr:dihydroxyacetone kinase subunit L [Planctomycetaceae bacterium]
MKFTKKLLQQMLSSAMAAVAANVDELNRLDAATGDGDHGTAILAAIKAAASSSQKDGDLAKTLETIGWDVMSSASGSTSTLTGSFFIGMANAVVSDELNLSETIAIFESGLDNVKASTKAAIGDKTLMDALIPAIEAMVGLKDSGKSIVDVFQSAYEAAQKGADSTKNLIAKFGRAKNIGDRSRGNLDAGAVSTAIIYKSYAETIQNTDQNSELN